MLTTLKNKMSRILVVGLLPASMGLALASNTFAAEHAGRMIPVASTATSDGPGLGGGYGSLTDSDGPGNGGGYGKLLCNEDGPGAGGGYGKFTCNNDGPGVGGGYGQLTDGPGLGGGY